METLIKIFVDDTSYDTEDGFTLYTYSPYKAGIMVEEAINNGFEDIRISKAEPMEKLEYDRRHNNIGLAENIAFN